ncbi:UNVERIFIED_CONTAM: F-box protein [Sesamum angustifolium]|uniref:F-box protein n=1 Tax=Sesamum angustifolium TaxID=2727405 RepID=A0AAW2MSL7_9LAMI
MGEDEEHDGVAGEGDDGKFNLKGSALSHSHGVQPLGNLYFSSSSINSRDTGLGNLQALTDELILEVLGLLSGTDLAFYQLDFYSDYLFQSWLCANLEMKPEWLERDNIVRKKGISVEEFVLNFEEPNKPVLLEGCLENWPAMGKWDREYLIEVCGDALFSVGPVEMKLEDYFLYSDQVKEERPLYLFDPKFADKVPQLGFDYEVPEYFNEDLFSVLGNERPDYRWIIIGPAGSGSSFHIDPNSTSAWNAVIRGSKKWVLFPPDVVPPGVLPSPDGAEVACPVSIIEWFMNFYNATKGWKNRPIECVCKAGEVIFVPNGWWHLVFNLEDSVAITQNFVSRRNLLNVLDFLKRPNARTLVSGTRDRVNLHEKFKNAIEASLPGTLDELRQKAEEKKQQQKKLSFWESVADSKMNMFVEKLYKVPMRLCPKLRSHNFMIVSLSRMVVDW